MLARRKEKRREREREKEQVEWNEGKMNEGCKFCLKAVEN